MKQGMAFFFYWSKTRKPRSAAINLVIMEICINGERARDEKL
jgi:hypothetical protein